MATTTFRGTVRATTAFSGPMGTGTGATPDAGSFTTLGATGAISASNGTVSLPAITFTSDTDSGVYRIGANNIGVAVNGAKVLDVATTGLTVTGATASTTLAVGSGTAITGIVVYSQTITPASVAAATVAEQTFTVTGLTTADKVFVNHAATGNATGLAGVRVSAANTLAVSFVNPTAGALTPAAGTWTIVAMRS